MTKMTADEQLFATVAFDCGYQQGYDDGKADERKAIVKWLQALSDPGSTFQDRRLAYQMAAEQFADALEAGEHLK